jgi:hypothetical protein
MGGGRQLHNVELHNLYSSPSIIRIIKSTRMGWAGHVARVGEKRNVYNLFVEKPEGKRPLRRPRRRWFNLVEMVWGGVGWTGLVWQVGSSCKLGNEPSGSIKSWEIAEWLHNL